ncbi:MAG: NADP-dependent phosphogluconate dehydrogenase, partial [Acidobacteria bacterium]|nr:NADP-dependent phosphogluconate dehydrogenase [Acidobacteriota bacterium]
MQLGMIGLGRMGGGMTRRLLSAGHSVVVHDVDKHSMQRLAEDGARAAESVEALVASLQAPRAVWVMVPAGDTTERVIATLAERLDQGDVIIDGGNAHFKDSVRRSEQLAPRGVHFVDAGTSGGVWGEKRGYCLMIGAAPAVFARLEPIFRALAPGRGNVPPAEGRASRTSTAEEGYLHCGAPGSGHFVKMVHNGIEYGLMQAYAEGFDLLRRASGDDIPENWRFDIDVADVAELWRRGS